MHASIILGAVVVLITLRLLYPLLTTFRPSLRHIPGPFAARFGRLWYFRQIWGGTFHHTNIELHRKYGPIVRLAPDFYSINTPDKAVYGYKSSFTKSDWYEGWKHPSPDRWTLFPDRNNKRHAETRRRFQSLYSMSSLVTYEHYVDVCADLFAQRLTEFHKSGEVVNMGHWFQCYAFDVIGSITYSKRFGFLDQGKDISGTLAALHSQMIYGTCIGVFPWAHPFMYAFLERFFPKSGAAGRSYLMGFVQERLNARKSEREKARVGGKTKIAGVESEKTLEEGLSDDTEVLPEDFLNKLLDAHDEDPEKVTNYHVFMMGLSNIIAGSDTTAVSLSSVLYHLLKYPATLEKLREEIETFEREGKCDKTRVKFAQSQEMPYLQACLKEGLRLHSATGLPLWREVPEGGAEVQGEYFPAGTNVGINTWVAHYDESVFGPDAKDFRPERWIEAEKEGGEKHKMMEAYHMSFGLGSRTCIGRHISILEMSKLLPQMVRSFDFELEQPQKDWTTQDYWFVKPLDFNVRVKPRR